MNETIDATSDDALPDHTGRSQLDFPVVGVGASAGGLSALQRLFAAMPNETGMAFVVVMHLSPDHESTLGAILQRSTAMPVVTVVDSTAIEADHVYVISPASRLSMRDGQLRVATAMTVEDRQKSIDLFFRSLALAHCERAVCVVLSGNGADGSLGLKRVKECGGISMAQSPEDAEYGDMPLNAVRTGLVDFVLPVAEMPRKLIALWKNARVIELPAAPPELRVKPVADEAELQAEEALLSIKALLRERTGHNFAHYKRATVLRRLERRMQVNALPDLPTYRRFLDSQVDETQALLQDMLISVTNFFRDPLAFAMLTRSLTKVVAERPPSDPFRAWIAGCATGEEAYSVAILLHELMGPLRTPIQVFASDIDERAIASARTGFYPFSIATDVTAERLRSSFVAETNGYRISKSVRDSVVFSAQNVLSDPPFTRMDLICCRNLMIYLDRPAQVQLLNTFHFALKSHGVLLLGDAETVDAVDGYFVAEDKRHRLYRASPIAKRTQVLPPVALHLVRPLPINNGQAPPPAAHPPPLEALHDRVLQRYAPPTVLVDADDTVLHVSERASHLLRLPKGAPSNKLMALARPEIRVELRAALSRAMQTGRSVEARRVRLQINGGTHFLGMTVYPASEEMSPGLMLVVFDEAEETLYAEDSGAEGADRVVETLEAQLLRAQDHLRATAGESAAFTEELRASNEELQTINEELRSTTEELETSREELQAVNEELTTVNSELQSKIEEAVKSSDDLQNLMVSAEIGTVFVDREMRVKRFTPQAATIFNLLPTDLDRPLLDITHRLDYSDLHADLKAAIDSLHRAEREVRSADSRWFVARAVPYLTAEKRIAGAILTLFDISARRAAEEQLRLSEQRMHLVSESMRDYAIVTMDTSGIVTSWSSGAERVFGFTAHEMIGKSCELIFTPEDRLAGAPHDEMRRARDHGRAEEDRWHIRKEGERIFCSGIMSPLLDGGLVGFAKITRDFTSAELRDTHREAALADERAARGRLEEASVMKDEFLAVMSHELKNPLAVIQMNAQLLQRLPQLDEMPRAARATHAIRSAVASQVQIINDLLELSRVTTGKVSLSPARLSFGQLVDDIVEALGPDARAKRQTLTVERHGALSIVGDAVRIEQIVWNLLTNAVKFTPEDGSIRLSLDVDARMARLRVTDSGLGIEPRHLGNIFEMFRQVETGSSRKKTGLGIGLALAKQLAEMHGGRVEATSAGLGQGSSFTVWLPLAPDAAAGTMPASHAPAIAGFSGMRILLVDDEPLLLDSFAELLQAEGAEVVAVDSARAALQTAKDRDFDVVVSDIAMPEYDGYWLAGQLRESPQTRTLPLVAVSGMARQADRQKAIDSGFDAHVGKPLELEQLLEEIRRAMDEGRNDMR